MSGSSEVRAEIPVAPVTGWAEQYSGIIMDFAERITQEKADQQLSAMGIQSCRPSQ
jgi:hypothetical protein